MAIKWIHEEVLQRYIKENPHKWNIDGKKVLAVEYNVPFDRYPDLFFTVEGESNRIPVEVEWTSADFDHPIDVLKDNKGWVFVCYKNKEDSEIGVPQFEISHKDFTKWVTSNAEKLVSETISNYKKPHVRKIPKLWIQYISKRGGAVEDYKIALKANTWGVPKNGTNGKRLQNIQNGDLIMFVIEGTGFHGYTREKDWHKNSFPGKFEKIQVFRVTRGYYYSEEIIWPFKNNKKEVYPHRFNFDAGDEGKAPFVNLKNLIIKKMSYPGKEQLRQAISKFDEADGSTLVDCIHSSEQATQ